MRRVYHELYPTCPRCKNESLIIRSGLLGNYFTCDQCGFDKPIDILFNVDDEDYPCENEPIEIEKVI